VLNISEMVAARKKPGSPPGFWRPCGNAVQVRNQMRSRVAARTLKNYNQSPQSFVILDTIDDQVRTIYVITNSERLKGLASDE
jgi:hypothetical protein